MREQADTFERKGAVRANRRWGVRLLQAAAALICIGPIVYFASYPDDPPCVHRLQVQLDELPAGTYDLTITTDDYANHCRLSRKRSLNIACDDSWGIMIMNEVGRISFPSRARSAFLEIRRGPTTLVARDFGVWWKQDSKGCTGASFGVPFNPGPREPWPY